MLSWWVDGWEIDYLNVKKISDIERDRTAVHGRVVVCCAIEADIRSDGECHGFVLQRRWARRREEIVGEVFNGTI